MTKVLFNEVDYPNDWQETELANDFIGWVLKGLATTGEKERIDREVKSQAIRDMLKEKIIQERMEDIENEEYKYGEERVAEE